MEVGVLFSKNDILAFNKPAGMCSQGSGASDIPDLWELLRMYYPNGHVVHRIDKFTSGVNLAATSREQIRYLMSNWHRITRKSYLAITTIPPWNQITVDMPINGKSAFTDFKVIEKIEKFALIQCQMIQHGRTHQIRRHLRSIGIPIVGDRKYGGMKTDVRFGQLLHAWRMEVKLPEESWVTIQAPIPEDFKRFDFNWESLDANANTIVETWLVPFDRRN